ncbi:MAG: citrate (Si)-synthase [bacterium]
MSALHDAVAAKVPVFRQKLSDLVTEHGEKVISEVTLKQAFGGLRGVKALLCDTSCVEPDRGLLIRGTPIAELTDRHPEEIFYLLLSSELPDQEALTDLRDQLAGHQETPSYVFDILRSMPGEAHPMDMLITALVSLEDGSFFRRSYDEGVAKDRYWEPLLDDALSLLAKLPVVAAAVYRIRYDRGEVIPPDPQLGYSANFARMLGFDDPEFADLVRLYLTLHSDHEGGNVSAYTSRVVASALADPFYSVSAGLCGLAGPLHGLANQESLKFNLAIMERFDGPPTPEQMKEYTWELLDSGQVVPGYGHAVLRVTDPRFTALHGFAKEHFPEDPLFQTVDVGFEVIPEVLQEHGKAKNPWPNVDAGSGCTVYHYGMTEMDYYTVLFSVSRAMGMLAQQVLCRAAMEPITRPKSVTTDWVQACMDATDVAMTPG